MTKMEARNPQGIQDKIQALQKELAERKKALPRHTIRPHQLKAIEDLEDQILALEQQIPPRFEQKGGQE